MLDTWVKGLERKNWAVRLAGYCDLLGQFLERRGWGRFRLGRWLIDALFWPRDLLNTLSTYCKHFGRYPRLTSPKTFNEKIQHHKLFVRSRRHVTFADKLAARDYVASRLGKEVLTDLYWTGTDLRSAPCDRLPQRFVLKANHASGTNLIVDDREDLDWSEAHRVSQEWLETDYWQRFSEWQYRWIRPRLFIEEYLEGEDGKPPLDYKFFCFHGTVKLVQIDVDRFGDHTRCFIDRRFNRLEFGVLHPRYDGPLSRPPNFNDMIEMAEILAGDEPLLRVDFYDVGHPIFGEMTLHPGAGIEKFDPPKYDRVVGDLMEPCASSSILRRA